MWRSWLIAGGVIIGVWLLALGVMRILNGRMMTAEKVAALAAAPDLKTVTGAERQKRLDQLADAMNELPPEERDKMQKERLVDKQLRDALTKEERLLLIDKTIGNTMKAVMEKLNKMPSEERKKLVNNALAQMRRNNADATPEQIDRARQSLNDDGEMKRIMDAGFKSYINDANAESKMDLAPLIQQMQMNLQGLRN